MQQPTQSTPIMSPLTAMRQEDRIGTRLNTEPSEFMQILASWKAEQDSINQANEARHQQLAQQLDVKTSEIGKLERKVAALSKSNGELLKSNGELLKSNGKLAKQVATLSKSNEKLTAQVVELQEQNRQSEGKNRELESKVDALEKQEKFRQALYLAVEEKKSIENHFWMFLEREGHLMKDECRRYSLFCPPMDTTIAKLRKTFMKKTKLTESFLEQCAFPIQDATDDRNKHAHVSPSKRTMSAHELGESIMLLEEHYPNISKISEVLKKVTPEEYVCPMQKQKRH